jgi:apolipoprotein D and lipocalin family protein
MRPRNERWTPPKIPTETAAPPTAQRPVEAIAQLDPQQLVGTWHEIAHLPGSFGLTDNGVATLQFERHGNLALAVTRRPLDGSTPKGRIRRAAMRCPRPADEPARFRLRSAPEWLGWLPWVWSDCWVLALDTDAGWALLGDPDRRGLCLLSREPRMQRDLFDELKARARRMGYDLAPLVVSPYRAG